MSHVKKLLKILFSRLSFGILFIILQVGVLVVTLYYFNDTYAQVQTVFTVLSVITVLYIINQEGSSAFKIAWILPIVFLPVFGIPLYILFGKKRIPERKLERISGMLLRYRSAMAPYVEQHAASKLGSEDAVLQSAYLERSAASPVFTQTETTYYPIGEDFFPALLDELEKAERYIFMEYFIIEPGKMWDSVLDVLARKASAGVDVRLIYDDLSCIMRLPRDYPQRMEAMGIRCCTFHRFQPVPTGTLNNRDHRKICVVDGVTAFTGGINLADEYINERERFGHWLDCAVRIRGRAAYSFALMFLSMWDYISHEDDDLVAFRPAPGALDGIADDGFVQPYCDSPADDEPVGERTYINMISRAKKYVYICTPYLVVDNEIMNALASAAKCGVDVRIITPHVPDKWYVHLVTRSYYAPLIRAGVRVYEYTPGFIHSKTFVCDDDYGICGTINLDYRSLFLHHECAVWMYKSSAVAGMKASYLETLPKCMEITRDMLSRRRWYVRLGQSILRVLAPLM